MQNWAEANFPALVNFYNSSIGFIIQSLILISIFISYIFLRILKEDSEQIKFDRVVTTKWQDKLYRNEYIRMIIDAFKPKPHTAKLRKIEKLIKNNNAYLTVEWLYINKLVTALGVTLAMLILLVNINYINLNQIYNKLSDEFVSFGKLTPQQEQAAKALNDRDRTYVEKYKDAKISKEELASELKSANKGQLDQSEVDRVWDKINQVRNAYYKYWYLLIALALGYIGYLFPTFLLIIKNKIREMEKENEIMQFQSIILMLMYIERIDVQTILEWLARFSYAFKEPISTALNNYEAGAYEALEELKDAVPYKDFERIVEQLQSAVERIPIRAAFDELETERSYYYERRKSGNEQLIAKKVMIGKALGFAPMVILVGGYLVAPLMIVSLMQMMNYFGQIMV